jgi:hypothetical protein
MTIGWATIGFAWKKPSMYKNVIDPTRLTREYDQIYPEKDYHTLYFGEIQACYEV